MASKQLQLQLTDAADGSVLLDTTITIDTVEQIEISVGNESDGSA